MHSGTREALRHAKGLQPPVSCGAELLLRSTTRVGSRVSRREHPRVPSTPLSSGRPNAERPPIGPNPPSHTFPGLSHSQHPQPSLRRDDSRVRANQSACYGHRPANQEAPCCPGGPASRRLPADRRGSPRGSPANALRTSAPRRARPASRGVPFPRWRRAGAATVPAGSGGPRGPCWGRSQAGGRRRGRPRAVIGGRPAVAEVLAAARARQAESAAGEPRGCCCPWCSTRTPCATCSRAS